MAIKFQYNKTSLQQLEKQLKVRVRTLPIIKNKVRLADQGNMLVFAASFNFSHGRRYHTGSRKLNNSDRDNGIR